LMRGVWTCIDYDAHQKTGAGPLADGNAARCGRRMLRGGPAKLGGRRLVGASGWPRRCRAGFFVRLPRTCHYLPGPRRIRPTLGDPGTALGHG